MSNKKSDKNEKRGLASADEETRQRVASEGGKASHKNDSKGKKKQSSKDMDPLHFFNTFYKNKFQIKRNKGI